MEHHTHPQATDDDPARPAAQRLHSTTLLFERIARAGNVLRDHGGGQKVAILLIEVGADDPAERHVAASTAAATVQVESVGRLARAVRPGDTVARWSDGTFVVLLERLDPHDGAAAIANRIDAALREPVVLEGGRALRPRVTTRILEADPAVIDPVAALRDLERSPAGTLPRVGADWVLLDDGLRERLEQRRRTETALRETRHGEELELAFQPVVALDTGRISGVEALVRWRHGGRLVPPEEFVPTAERTGLIVPIGAWVLRTATATVARWQQLPGYEDLRLAVNVSARQIQHGDFEAEVVAAVDRSGLRPGTLWLELTETALIEDLPATTDRLQRLVGLGAHLSLDDFGTGYSSLAYLRRFPVRLVKLDRSFVAGVCDDVEDASIVAAVVDLATALGKECIAEGVETVEQHEKLRALGCRAGQGNFYSSPLPEAELDALLRSGSVEHPVTFGPVS